MFALNAKSEMSLTGILGALLIDSNALSRWDTYLKICGCVMWPHAAWQGNGVSK